MAKADIEATWRRRLDAWRVSGLRVAEFCRNEGVSTASFYKWRGRVGGGGGEAPTLKFVEVTPTVTRSATPIELEVGGVLVRLRSGFAVGDLRSVLAVLAERR